MPRRRHESLGDYISSACFGGVGFLALVNGIEALNSGEKLRAIIIWIVAFFLFLAVFTYGVICVTCCKNSCQSSCTKNNTESSPIASFIKFSSSVSLLSIEEDKIFS